MDAHTERLAVALQAQINHGRSPGRSYTTCSWCHREHEIAPNVALQDQVCNQCGHNAALPRCQCNCWRCLGAAHAAVDPIDYDELGIVD